MKSMIERNLSTIQEQIHQALSVAGRKREEVTLIAVTKGQTIEAMEAAYQLGLRDFGESRVQEALEKQALLPRDIRWHYLGTLQRNKVQKILGRFVLLHAIDRLDIAHTLSAAGIQKGVSTPVLLEVKTSREESKRGLSPASWKEHYPTLSLLEGISIGGLMTLAPLTTDESRIQECFAALRLLRDSLGDPTMELSMGMSQDFSLAIVEGATLIRVGRALFTPPT